MKHLKDAGIGSAIHYPVPLHLQKAYTLLNYSAGDFPVTEGAAAEIISLPMYPQLASVQQKRVADEITSFTSKIRRKPIDLEMIPAEPMA
jgi:dTDP-4-amino-4,6-dideoxygalactose transaminase